MSQARPGPYQLQAAIAAVHAEAPSPAETDWPAILGLYDRLLAMLPSPVVALNRAVAVAMARGPEAGLELVEEIGAGRELDGYHLLHATRADLLRRLGRFEEAAHASRQALGRTGNEVERRFLLGRLRQVEARGP